MKSLFKALAGALLLMAAFAVPAFAQTSLLDQIPAPGTVGNNNSELVTQYQSVAGGALYQAILKPVGGGPVSLAQTFVPGGGGSTTRYLQLIEGHSDLGVPFTATPGTPSGTVGVTRVAGTSLVLTGEATSSSAKTNKAIWEFNLPSTYIAGANIPVIVNANYTGGGTVTAVSTTMTAQLYTETAGVEAAVTTSAAQQISPTATNYTFTVTGTGLVPGQHVMLELVMLVTTSAGAATGQINSVAYNG